MKKLIISICILSSLIYSNETFASRRKPRRVVRVVHVFTESPVTPFLVIGSAFGIYLLMEKNAEEQEQKLYLQKTWRF